MCVYGPSRASLRFKPVVDSHWENPTKFSDTAFASLSKYRRHNKSCSMVAASVASSAIKPKKGARLQLSTIACLIQFRFGSCLKYTLFSGLLCQGVLSRRAMKFPRSSSCPRSAKFCRPHKMIASTIATRICLFFFTKVL